METATRVMLKVHTEGKGICGVFPRDVAETKAHLVNDYRVTRDLAFQELGAANLTGVVNPDDIAVLQKPGRTRVLQEALDKVRVGLAQ